MQILAPMLVRGLSRPPAPPVNPVAEDAYYRRHAPRPPRVLPALPLLAAIGMLIAAITSGHPQF